MRKQKQLGGDSKSGADPASSEKPRRKIVYFLYLPLLIGLLAISFFVGRKSGEDALFGSSPIQQNSSKTGIVKLKQGPWGDLESFPITIAAPIEILKVRGSENSLKWFFRGYSRDNLATLLNSLDLTSNQREQ